MAQVKPEWTWESAQQRSFGMSLFLKDIGSKATKIVESGHTGNIEGEGQSEPLLIYTLEDGSSFVEFFERGFCLSARKAEKLS